MCVWYRRSNAFKCLHKRIVQRITFVVNYIDVDK